MQNAKTFNTALCKKYVKKEVKDNGRTEHVLLDCRRLAQTK